ncbi:MAG: acyl-CoA mutase large subunit family protein [Candidatus Dormibacter sp.]|uniref:acyl-CoA mutase large subunit family protein n=1 Tax=Candidatus Dormibacter sp. TaxID=2973982 RepID=UPI000DAF83B1|nr:MAG: methylmalonyl-CoA mutase [Candidatus Dormibacteraeota bacterium]
MKVRYAKETFAEWQRQFEAAPKRSDGVSATTVSGAEIEPLYTSASPADGPEELPGEFPYTRGIHAAGYRGRLWTMRQFAGFATAAETNRRYNYLLENGQTGLSVAFDMPTLMGQDSDAPTSRGEIGHCGVAIDSLDDMETLFRGIPLAQVSTSMTINSPAAVLLCMYLAVAEKQGASMKQLNGTLQNDILKEFIAQKEFIFPPEPSMRLVVDSIEYCAKEVPRWNTVSISGYHIREAGSTAAQELAFTLADGFAYVDACLERGLKIDDFAPRLAYFFDAHIDFFEEIAKFRAARRIWARHLRDRYGAQDERSLKLRFHTQTAGVSLTAQQPELNVARTAIEALSAVLGGTQSLHTNAMDEVLGLPTDKSARIALRTQQMLAFESGVANTVDPLGGSYFVEALTDRMEAEAEAYFERIDAYGGVIPAIEAGFMQKEIADAAFRHQQELETRQRLIVGVNEFTAGNEEDEIEILRIPPRLEQEQVERVREVRRRRDQARAAKAVTELRKAAASPSENLMPYILDAVRAYCTEGEIMGAMVDVFGLYTEKAVI